MINFLRKIIPDRNPLRLFYHKVMAGIAALVYMFPAKNAVVIGITGTNGKTTVANLLANVLGAAGHKVGMITTINFRIGDEQWTNVTKQTTFGRFKLQGLIKRMIKEDCKYIILEISSQAITQSRMVGVDIDVGIMTNIAPEHIEYHGGFDNYLDAKSQLFKKVSNGKKKIGVRKSIILNHDDKYYSHFNQFPCDEKIDYGLEEGNSLYVSGIENAASGTSFVMHYAGESVPVNLHLPGEFNIYNALAAAGAALTLSVPLESVKKGLDETRGVAGRFEHVDCGQKYSVVVDYAHGPESLEHLFALYRKRVPGRLFGVFGATGGGRDIGKRPKMGEVADKICDYIILTDDDPYSDDEWEIIENIAEGVDRTEGEKFWKIPDRKEAIRLALSLAKEGDCVMVAGKGCEEVMKVRGKTIPWNDRKVIEELLNREIEVEIGPSQWAKRENVCKGG